MHTSIIFKARRLQHSYLYGRFNNVEGRITTGSSPSFEFTVATASIDINSKKRDDHLRSPAFFNACQFPTMCFKTTDVT